MTETSPVRYFFCHVLKTGGTDLLARLGGAPSVRLAHEPSFSEAEIYPNSSDGDPFKDQPQVLVARLLERWRVRGDEIRIILGHFPLCTVELLDAEFKTLTVLREPVERTLSHLRHHRVVIEADRDLPLEAIYEDPFRFESLLHNHMVKMFSLTTAEMGGGVISHVDLTPDHLERAKERLARVDVVGLQEHFEDFCAELERRFGWCLGDPLHAARTEPVSVPDSFRKRIHEDNALDVELYEFATRLYSERRS